MGVLVFKLAKTQLVESIFVGCIGLAQDNVSSTLLDSLNICCFVCVTVILPYTAWLIYLQFPWASSNPQPPSVYFEGGRELWAEKFSKKLDPPPDMVPEKNGVDGGPSGGSSGRRPRSKDPHRCLYIFIYLALQIMLCYVFYWSSIHSIQCK